MSVTKSDLDYLKHRIDQDIRYLQAQITTLKDRVEELSEEVYSR